RKETFGIATFHGVENVRRKFQSRNLVRRGLRRLHRPVCSKHDVIRRRKSAQGSHRPRECRVGTFVILSLELVEGSGWEEVRTVLRHTILYTACKYGHSSTRVND